jgi:hypothetical protein
MPDYTSSFKENHPDEIINRDCIEERYVYNIGGREDEVLENIWTIGGENGWYYGTSLWKFRGFVDNLFGGIGYRKGRKHPFELKTGDQIDFWRVVQANKPSRLLLLKAEMTLPGEVFLEWKIKKDKLYQTVFFLPKGKFGKLYWYLVKPFHYWIFFKMGKKLAGNPIK